jgi:hypothetical protein
MLPSARVRAVLAAVVPAGLLLAVAAWEVVASVRAPGGVPGDAAWRQAASAVRAVRVPGELIVFAPDWVDPVGRLHLGDLVSIEEAARMDAARYPVVWELSIRGARHPDTAGRRLATSLEFDGVAVRRWERVEPVFVVADFVGLASRIEARGALARMPEAVVAEVGFAPRRCVQVVPTPGGTVTLDFGLVPLGDTLVGYVGLADVFTRRDVREPGRLVVRIDGQDVAGVTAGVDDGWRRFEVPTTPGQRAVEVRATAVGPGARDRRICFAMEARR